MEPENLRLSRYLNETLGIAVTPISWNGSSAQPFFLRDLYAFFEVQLLGTPCLLMLDRSDQEQSPATIRKHIDQLRASWNGEIVYVRNKVTAYNRKRLIEHKAPFVVPGNQMYLPFLGVDLREHFRKLRTQRPSLSPSTQALLIDVLLRGNGTNTYTPAETALRLAYSAMTLTRAFDELESAGLGEIFLKGRERFIRFAEPMKDTWEKARPLLRSPVKKRFHIEPYAGDPPGPWAGLTALAYYGTLAEPKNPVIALSREGWKSLKQNQNVIEFPAPEPGAMEVEVWGYEPRLFAERNIVDRLSLYLSLQDDKDERVESALEEMMKGLPW